jgi:hypothetical protein
MSVLDKLACALGRRDEVPNQELARDLVKSGDAAAIRELVDNLWNTNKDIRFDCIKTLYEIGYQKLELIAGHAAEFIKLITDKENRMVWGGMLALTTVAALNPEPIFQDLELFKKVIQKGSVITVDGGVKALALAASADEKYRSVILSWLLEFLSSVRPKSVAQYAESILPAVDAAHKQEFIAVLNQRLTDLSPSQAARVKKAIKIAESR